MQVSVENLSGLERKLTISVPTEKVEEEVSQRLKELAHKVKMDGFRPGKVPFEKVKQRYSDDVRQEVAREMVQSTLRDALKDNELVPAGYPEVEPEVIEFGKDFKYTAKIEVFPTFEINELAQAEVESVTTEVTEADVDKMIQQMREQNQDWKEVTRAVQSGDKVRVDFEGFLDDKPFDGGKAEGYELVIGSGQMIPGFEDGLIGGKPNEPFEITLTFPENYNHKDLAGKETRFKVTVSSVEEGVLPELDDAFARLYNIEEGGMDALRKDIQLNMERELERRLKSINADKVFDRLLEKNTFDLPNALIEQEIGHLKHDMFHRIFGPDHREGEKIPDFPRELFEEQAKRRVHLGLLFSEYVKKHKLVVDKERTNALIEKMATAYEKPEELRSWYTSDKERYAEVEALAMEDVVIEKILEDAKIIEKMMKYDDVMNPKKDNEEKGEA